MKITKENALRLAQMARLVVKSPKGFIKAYNTGAFNSLEYASILVETLLKDKNLILITNNFMSCQHGTVEWILGRALTWALENRKKEKELNKRLRDSDSKRYNEWLQKTAVRNLG